MELRYQYQIRLTLRRTRRKTYEYIPNMYDYGRRSLVIDLCDLETMPPTDRSVDEEVLDLIYQDLYESKVLPLVEAEREKRVSVVVEKVSYDLGAIEVYDPDNDAWIDLSDYLDELEEYDLCE